MGNSHSSGEGSPSQRIHSRCYERAGSPFESQPLNSREGMMKEKGVQVGNISEIRCAIFVSSVQVSNCCVMEIFHDL
jgi:hypothetical protein